MPLPEIPVKPEAAPEETPTTQGTPGGDSGEFSEAVDPKAPLSFVPHTAQDWQQPFKLKTNRFGELDEHELVKLLDSIEDERARARFRESIYISIFVWMLIAWVAFYGPKYLWHAPKMIDPITALKQKELTILNAPVLPRSPVPRPAPKLDNKTLERLRREAPPTPAPVAPKTEAAPQPAPSASMAPTPSAPTPPPPSPSSVRPAPSVPDAPLPSAPRPSFATGGGSSPGFSARSGGGDIGTARAPNGANMGTGGIDVLSDTEGVDFSAYFRRMHTDILNNWAPLLPVETQPPLMKNGETFIIVKIMADGTIADMKLDYSTHDDAINKSAWGSITSEGQFPPLPKQFHGPYIILRMKYYVNEQPR